MALALLAAAGSTAQTPDAQPGTPPAQTVPQPPVPVRIVDPPMAVRVVDPPLAVRVVEAPKTEAQFDAERRERDDRAALYDQLLIFAALLVAVGAFLAIAFAMQAYYQSLALRAMRRSAQLTERNIAAAQRAFVYISALNWSAAGANVKISPIWANAGATPTRRLRISTNWRRRTASCRPTSTSIMCGRRKTCSSGPTARLRSAPSSFRCATSRRRSRASQSLRLGARDL
jgi:hypothetical protein